MLNRSLSPLFGSFSAYPSSQPKRAASRRWSSLRAGNRRIMTYLMSVHRVPSTGAGGRTGGP